MTAGSFSSGFPPPTQLAKDNAVMSMSPYCTLVQGGLFSTLPQSLRADTSCRLAGVTSLSALGIRGRARLLDFLIQFLLLFLPSFFLIFILSSSFLAHRLSTPLSRLRRTPAFSVSSRLVQPASFGLGHTANPILQSPVEVG